MSRNTLAEPMTSRQNEFAARLFHAADGNLSSLTIDQTEILERMKGHEPVTFDEAKYLISGLLKCAPERVAAKPGVYKLGDDFVWVVLNADAQRCYAKRLVVTGTGRNKKAKWKYERGLVYELGGARRLTTAQANRLPR